QLEVHEVAYDSTYSKVEIQCGDWSLPIAEASTVTGNRWYEHRTLVYAHLPTRTFLFYRWRTTIEPGRHVSAGYELYVDGEQVTVPQPAEIDTAFAAGLFDLQTADNMLRQMAVSYDDGVGTSWRRPMDA